MCHQLSGIKLHIQLHHCETDVVDDNEELANIYYKCKCIYFLNLLVGVQCKNILASLL